MALGLCHHLTMPIKKKVRYQKAATRRAKAATLKANAAKAPKKTARPREDFSQAAARIVREATQT